METKSGTATATRTDRGGKWHSFVGLDGLPIRMRLALSAGDTEPKWDVQICRLRAERAHTTWISLYCGRGR